MSGKEEGWARCVREEVGYRDTAASKNKMASCGPTQYKCVNKQAGKTERAEKKLCYTFHTHGSDLIPHSITAPLPRTEVRPV